LFGQVEQLADGLAYPAVVRLGGPRLLGDLLQRAARLLLGTAEAAELG